MNWKNISKSSYILDVGKFAEWTPSHPFTIPYQGPKIRYSEGDEISSVADPVFNIEFTGNPLSGQHFPCGYWHKNYVPPQVTIYTSCPYPLEFGDSVSSTAIAIESGYLNARIDHYTYPSDYVEDLGIEIESGVFRSMVLKTYPHAYIQSTSLTLVSGVFKEVVHRYTDISSVTSGPILVSSGVFKDVVINYDYWTPEGVEDLGILLVSGSHAN